jgi:hypothetical protein
MNTIINNQLVILFSFVACLSSCKQKSQHEEVKSEEATQNFQVIKIRRSAPNVFTNENLKRLVKNTFIPNVHIKEKNFQETLNYLYSRGSECHNEYELRGKGLPFKVDTKVDLNKKITMHRKKINYADLLTEVCKHFDLNWEIDGHFIFITGNKKIKRQTNYEEKR